MTMTLTNARTIAAELDAKNKAGVPLTEEDTKNLSLATATIGAAVEAINPGSTDTVRRQIHDHLANDTPSTGKVKFFGMSMSPTVKLATQVLGTIGLCSLSAFGGMKYEQRRQVKRDRDNLLGIANTTSLGEVTVPAATVEVVAIPAQAQVSSRGSRASAVH